MNYENQFITIVQLTRYALVSFKFTQRIFYLPILTLCLWFWTKRQFTWIGFFSDFFNFGSISIWRFDCSRSCSGCRIVGLLIFRFITWPFKVRNFLLWYFCCSLGLPRWGYTNLAVIWFLFRNLFKTWSIIELVEIYLIRFFNIIFRKH